MTAGAFDAIVIGGGPNGLVAAARLAQAGRRTVLLEGAGALGGLHRTVEFAPGFRAAPLAIDPGWAPDPVVRGLGLDGLDRDPSAAPLSVAIEPGTFLTLARDPARAAEAIRVHAPADAAAWPAFTARLRTLAGFLEALYQAPAPDVAARGAGELLSLLDLGRRFRALGREDMTAFLRTLPLPVSDLVGNAFAFAPLQAAVAAGGIQDHRQGPRSGGTSFVLLHHLTGAARGAVRGRAPWRAGPDAFVRSAERAARRLGVTVRTGVAVERILVRDDAVAGVVLAGGEEVAARAVLSTESAARTLLGRVDPEWLDPEFMHAVANIRHRGCTAWVMYALDAAPELRGLASLDAMGGIVTLTRDLVALERAADAAKYGEVSAVPHVELHAPTVATPGLAPAGGHVLIARVQYAPYALRDGAAWDAARSAALAERVTAAIETHAPGFGARVRHREVWSPADVEARFGLPEGAVPQGELALDQILFMRPVPGWAHHATPIDGLYLGGDGSHPGPGILGGAGWLAAGRLLDDAKGRRR